MAGVSNANMPDNGNGLHFHRGKNRLSLKTSFMKVAATKSRERLAYQRFEHYTRFTSLVDETVTECADAVYECVLKNVADFVNETADKTNRAQQPRPLLRTGLIQFGASDDEKFFADLTAVVHCPVARVRADSCKAVQKGIQHAITAFVEAICGNASESDGAEFKLCTVNRFVAWYENNNSHRSSKSGSPAPSPRKRARLPATDDKQLSPFTTNRLVLILENFEAFDRRVVDDLIFVLSSHCHRLPLVLLLGVATDVRTVHGRLSHQAYTLLSLKNFHFPPAALFADKMIQRLCFDERILFCLDPVTWRLLKGRYSVENYSMFELIKAYRLALLEHFVSSPASLLCCEEPTAQDIVNLQMNENELGDLLKLKSVKHDELATKKPCERRRQIIDEMSELHAYIRSYVSVLRVYQCLLRDIPIEEPKLANPSLNALHVVVQTHKNTDGSHFFEAKMKQEHDSVLGWSKEEWLERLVEVRAILEKVNGIEFMTKLRTISQLVNDLENVESRQEKLIAEESHSKKEAAVSDSTDVASCENEREQPPSLSEKRKSGKKTFHQMQADMKKKCLRSAHIDLLKKDKRRAVEFVVRLLRDYLRPIETVPLNECLRLPYDLSYRNRTMGAPNRLFDQAIVTPLSIFKIDSDATKSSKPKTGQSLDLTTAFNAYQQVASGGKTVKMQEWMKAFCKAAGIPQNDNTRLARFYRCVGELELLGCVKAASERNLKSAQKIYWTGSLVDG